MGSGFSKMKKQARQMEQQMEAMRDEMKQQRFTGSSGNGLVTVVIDGEKKLQELKIKPECVDPEDVEGLEDLISAAFTEAFSKAEANSSQAGPSFPF